MAIPEAIGNQTNIPLVDTTYLPVSCWPGRYRDPKQQGYSHCSVIGKTLFLKIPHTLAAGHREIKLELKWKLPPCWLSCTVPEDAMQVAEVGDTSHQLFFTQQRT